MRRVMRVCSGRHAVYAIGAFVLLSFSTMSACATAQPRVSRPTETEAPAQRPPVLLVRSRFQPCSTRDPSTPPPPGLEALRRSGLFRFDDIDIDAQLAFGSLLPTADGRSLVFVAMNCTATPTDSVAGPIVAYSILRYDRASATTSELVAGGTSVAASDDGRLAFTRPTGDPTTQNGLQFGGDIGGNEVVVRDRLDGKDHVWSSTTGNYVVVAWAGQRLIVESGSNLLVVDGPGSARSVPSARLLALSPRGDRMLVQRYTGGSGVEMLRIDDLSEVVTPFLAEFANAVDIEWIGTRIVAQVYTNAGSQYLVVDPEGRRPPVTFLPPTEARTFLAGPWLMPDHGLAGALASYDAESITASMWRCDERGRCHESEPVATEVFSDYSYVRASNPSRPSSLPVVQQ